MVTPAPIELSTLSMPDTLILMVLALVVFGPRRLPQIGRQIGKLMYEFRKASNDFKFQMEEELRLAEEADRRKQEEAQRQQAALAAPPPVEAQADIGAVEPSAEAAVTGAAMAQPAEEEPEVVHLPRVAAPIIQPPSTGTPVPAARRGAALELASEPAAEPVAEVAAEANIGAAQQSVIPAEPTESEPANQHG